ncbi:winged helix-turn-helix domain-containing protein, partial [Streptomyces sp. NPDC019890]|uniref:winged helix-turn-helix domain-containing protein n=1 Tax=Streptomyces sp. NPDC019890 TaxID=3365064 RepID=UPI00385173A2
EFDLLYHLASRPDTVVSRKELMARVWGDTWSRRTVDTHVCSLRSKLGSADWVITVRGVGFRLGYG